MRTIFRVATLFLCIMAVSFPFNAYADAKQQERAEKLEQIRAAYPDVAAALDANAEAKERFMALFPAAQKEWAEKLISRVNEFTRYAMDGMSQKGKYGEKNRAKFLKRSGDNTRFMRLMTETPVTDPAFLILLRPVCRFSAYNADQDIIKKTLSEYDAYKKSGVLDAKKYSTRRVNGQYWAAVLMPEEGIAHSSSDDRNLAYVLRVKDGTFTVSPVISPVREDYYIGEKSLLRPEKSQRGPYEININECKMKNVLTITNTEGPFAFRADAEQFHDKGLSYICEPKCTGFTYAWNDVTNSFHMSDGICREDDGWKPKSPFEGETLLPVKNYTQELAKKNEAVAAHEKVVQEAAAGFIASFDGETAKEAEKNMREWLFDRQLPLYHLIGQEQAFISRMQEFDAPALAFMQKVISLVKTPDARLTLLLDDMARRQAHPDRNKDSYNTRREPRPYDLLRSDAKTPRSPWFADYAKKQMALFAAPAKDRYGEVLYTAKGLEGGETIEFAYPRRSYRNKEATFEYNRYLMKKGTDGAYWGLASLKHQADGYRGNYIQRQQTEKHRIMRVANGKVSFVPLDLPQEKEFFTNPTMAWGDFVAWKDKDGREQNCSMQPMFSIDTTKTPFVIIAKDVQHEYLDYIECVPECSIPYTWNGKAYVKGAPVCLPEGKWGATVKERQR